MEVLKEETIDLSFYDIFIEFQQIIEKKQFEIEKIPFYISQMLTSIKYLNQTTNRDLFDCKILKFYWNRIPINQEKYAGILKNRLQSISFEKECLFILKNYLLYMKETKDYENFLTTLKILIFIFSIQNQRIENMKNEILKLNNPSYFPNDLEESKLKKQLKESIKELHLKK